jgi:hypothetical protein
LPQSEVSIAIDPSSPDILLAGSNDIGEPAMRAYGSTDGGRTWTSETAPPLIGGVGGFAADPAVGIGPDGRQYFGFLEGSPRQTEHSPFHIYVATRPGATSQWSTVTSPVAPLDGAVGDDKDMLTVDNAPTSPHRGRVYVAWSRFYTHRAYLEVSHSDDGAATWSAPTRIPTGLSVSFATLAVSRTGDVYLGWDDYAAVWVTRSKDGGDTWDPPAAVVNRTSGGSRCPRRFDDAIPAQPDRCVDADPTVVVDGSTGAYSGRVYVTYSNGGGNGQTDVFAAAFDPDLVAVGQNTVPGEAGVQVNPSDGATPSDQFLPAAAVDPSTGMLWVCFYDTTGDPTRVRTRYTCTESPDGGRTFVRPVPVASATSDETQLGADRGDHGNQYGDYEGVAANFGVAHPAWTDGRMIGRLDAEEIFSAVVTPPPG